MNFKELVSCHCCCCSVAQSCPTLCNPMDCSTPGLSIPHHLPKHAQVHAHYIGDAIQQSHPLMPSSSALNLSRHQGLFQWVSCSYQKTKILEFQLQYQTFQWIFKIWFCIVFLKKSTPDSISLRPHISWICPDTWHRACISLVSWCTTMRSPCQ